MEVLKRFNPYELTPEQVRHQSTGRASQVARLLRIIEENAARREPPNQHVLVHGPRGMGKSFLVRLLHIEVQQRAQAGAPMAFVLLPEEQLNVSAPELLLEEIRRVFEGRPAETVRVKWHAGGETEWCQALEALKRSLQGHSAFADGGGLLVVSIENFDVLLDSVFHDDAALSRLRTMLEAESQIMLLATATRPADTQYEERLFHAFKREPLTLWSPDDFVAYYRKIYGDRQASSLGQEAKVKALAHFMGGMPRLAVLMGEILHTNDVLSAAQTLGKLVDELTPYYQDRIMERLNQKSRWLLDELLRGGEPCSQTELARRVGAGGQADIARPFQELLHDGILVGERETRGRNTLYRAADRIFAHFYRRRYLAGAIDSPLAHMADFLESFYTIEERLDYVFRLAAAGHLDAARAMTQTFHDTLDGGITTSSRLRLSIRLLDETLKVTEKNRRRGAWHDLTKIRDLLAHAQSHEAIALHSHSKLQKGSPMQQAVWCIVYAALEMALVITRKTLSVMEKALIKAHQAKTRDLEVIALDGLGLLTSLLNESEAAEDYFGRAIAIAKDAGMPVLLAQSLLDQMWHTLQMSRFDAALVQFDAVHEAVKACNDDGMRSSLYRHRARARGNLGQLQEGLDDIQRAVQLASGPGNDYQLAKAEEIHAWFLYQAGRYDDAVAAARRNAAAAKRLSSDDYLLNAKLQELHVLSAIPNPSEFIEQAQEVFTLAEGQRDFRNMTWLSQTLAYFYKQDGRHEEAQRALQQAANAALRSEDIGLIRQTHNDLLMQSTKNTLQHADSIFDVYRQWAAKDIPTETTPSADSGDQPAPTPIHWLPHFLAASTFAERWQEANDYLTEWLDWAGDALKSASRHGPAGAVGRAIVEVFNSEGTGPAYEVATCFVRQAGVILQAPVVHEEVHALWSKLVGVTCTWLVATLDDPDLLRDIASAVRDHIGHDANSIATALEATALFHESGGDVTQLERVDPDIRTMIYALLHGRQNPQDQRLPRADHKVDADECLTIAAGLRDEVEWPTPPLYPALWETPEPAVAADLVATLRSASRAVGVMGWTALRAVQAVRTTRPSFYPGWLLVEALVTERASPPATLSWLLGKHSIRLISGQSSEIHSMNAAGALALPDSSGATDYLRFFCNTIRAASGPFRVVETLDQLPLAAAPGQDERSEITRQLRQVSVEQHDEESWKVTATIQYGSVLYLAHLTIKKSGFIAMTEDEPLLQIHGIKRERMAGCVRFFEGVFGISEAGESGTSQLAERSTLQSAFLEAL